MPFLLLLLGLRLLRESVSLQASRETQALFLDLSCPTAQRATCVSCKGLANRIFLNLGQYQHCSSFKENTLLSSMKYHIFQADRFYCQLTTMVRSRRTESTEARRIKECNLSLVESKFCRSEERRVG